MGSITRIGRGRLQSIGNIIDELRTKPTWFIYQYTEIEKQLVAKHDEMLARLDGTKRRIEELWGRTEKSKERKQRKLD